jgi:hypothetical protein
MRTIPALALGALVLALLVVPSAAAEDAKLVVSPHAPTVGVEGTAMPAGRLAPETSILKIEYVFDVLVPAASRCAGTIIVDYAPPPASDKYVATLSVASASRPFDGNGDADSPGDAVASPAGTKLKDWKTVLTVQLTRQAPAFETLAFVVKAKARLAEGSQCNLAESAWAEGQSQIAADYFPLMEYRPTFYMGRAAPNGDVTFRVEASNLGNGATRISTTLKPVDKGLEALIPPVDSLIESKVQSGQGAADKSILSLTARAPKHTGYSNSIQEFQATFRARAEAGGAASSAAVQETTLTFAVKVQGVSLPGFDAGPALAALGAVVVLSVARRRRGES